MKTRSKASAKSSTTLSEGQNALSMNPLPDTLKAGLESLSGYSMDDVQVHYNSDKPATVQAHAYAQGTDIHVAPGQEQHLPHEAWHVVQQKQGRVKPEVGQFNDNPTLEHEADTMGSKATQTGSRGASLRPPAYGIDFVDSAPIQRFQFTYGIANIDTETYVPGTFPATEPEFVSYLQKILASDFDPDTGEDLTKQDKDEIRTFISTLKGSTPNRRQTLGYQNPAHNSKIGLDLLEDGAHTPYDPNRWNSREDWLLSPNRNFQTYSPNSRNPDPVYTQGHDSVVFGHDEGASDHWNRIGHKQTPQQNRQWNQQKSTFHGLENYKKSSQSGGGSARYKKPDKKSGSNPMYFDPNDPDFDPKYQKIFM